MTQNGKPPSLPDTTALSRESTQAQVAAKTTSDFSLKASTTDRGFAIRYKTPSRRYPYKKCDWIGVDECSDLPLSAELGNYKTSDWPDNNTIIVKKYTKFIYLWLS